MLTMSGSEPGAACGISETGSRYQSGASAGFALSSLAPVVESRVIRAARPFWATGTMGVP
jgi:hypothetical protein